MTLKIDRESDARAIAQALEALYPSYTYVAKRWPRARKWSVAVYCRATGALIQTRAEV